MNKMEEIKLNIDVENSIAIPNEMTQAIGTICLVCGEYVLLESPLDYGYKICDKCKRAILKMRENLENGEL